jgi:hypothetical protein
VYCTGPAPVGARTIQDIQCRNTKSNKEKEGRAKTFLIDSHIISVRVRYLDSNNELDVGPYWSKINNNILVICKSVFTNLTNKIRPVSGRRHSTGFAVSSAFPFPFLFLSVLVCLDASGYTQAPVTFRLILSSARAPLIECGSLVSYLRALWYHKRARYSPMWVHIRRTPLFGCALLMFPLGGPKHEAIQLDFFHPPTFVDTIR